MVQKATESTDAREPASVATECSSRAGEVLDGKYELVRKIGEGGMGEVYEARHRVLGRRYAVKLLHPELRANERMLRRFSREVLAVSQLENDHLVPALDCGHTTQGDPYYVMEFLRGSDLRQLLRTEAPLATRRAVRLVIDACRGLMVAHQGGLVHRDLKPENVFVVRCDNGEESARVLDFGLVQLDASVSATQLGSLVGTVRYMAPEQARTDCRVDQRADVYALGAILYECLSGKPPHAGTSAEEVLFNRMNAAPKSLGEQRPELSSSLVSVVQRALESAPKNRYGSALELAEALLPFAGPGVNGLQTSYVLRPQPSSAFTGSDNTSETDFPEPARSGSVPKSARSPALAIGMATVVAAVTAVLYLAGRARPSLAPTLAKSAMVETSVTARALPPPASTPSTAQVIPQATSAKAQPTSAPKASAGVRPQAAPARSAHVSLDGVAPGVPKAFFDQDNPYQRVPRSP